MECAGFNGKRTSVALGWSASKVSRLLTGQLNLPETDIAAFLAVCHVTGDERDRLLRLSREPESPGWLQQHGAAIPEQLRILVDHENTATTVVDFQAIVCNGLLQTDEYARALLERSGTVPPREIHARLTARLARRSVFSRTDRPHFTFFVHEFVLWLPIGSHEIMSDQLHELLRMGVRTYIDIRVIPASFGAHAGTTGSSTLMEFAEFKPVVYVEEETTGHFLAGPDEIAAYQAIFASLADCALDEGQSRDLIASLAVDLYGRPASSNGRYNGNS